MAEHLLEPAKFLEKIHGLLRPGALCFVLVPNMNALAVRILGGRYRYIYEQHLNYFTARTLTKLAERWFTPIEVRYTHFNPLVIWQDWRSRGAEVSNAERGELLKRTTAYKQNPLMAPIRLAYRAAESALSALEITDNVVVAFSRI